MRLCVYFAGSTVELCRVDMPNKYILHHRGSDIVVSSCRACLYVLSRYMHPGDRVCEFRTEGRRVVQGLLELRGLPNTLNQGSCRKPETLKPICKATPLR